MSRKHIDWKADNIVIISMNSFNQSTTNGLYAITTSFVPKQINFQYQSMISWHDMTSKYTNFSESFQLQNFSPMHENKNCRALLE